MNTMSNKASKAYAAVGVESSVNGTDPHGLIVLLYEGALVAMVHAKIHMERNEIAEKGRAIAKAVAIINDGLRASLDMSRGGEIAGNLDALYDYMGQRLLLASLKNQPEIIDEISKLLMDLKGAWESIGKLQTGRVNVVVEQPQQRSAISYGKA
jgi:flagellar protein FliS